MPKQKRSGLMEQLQALPDPRVKGRCEHELVAILVIGLGCLLCGGETFHDMADFGRGRLWAWTARPCAAPWLAVPRPRVIVSAWAASNSLVLGQVQVPDKTNEITALPGWLRALELAGWIVTLDALGCQKEIAREIVEADYVLALKGNQGQCPTEIKAFLDDAVARHGHSRHQPDETQCRWPIRRRWRKTMDWFA